MKSRVPGLANIRTAVRCKIHTKPKAPDSDHLDIFLLEKNRSRLQQEIENVRERLERLNKDIQDIDEEIARISNAREGSAGAAEVSKGSRAKRNVPRSMKKMELRY